MVASRQIPLWFPLAILALLIAWPTVDHVRAAGNIEGRASELIVGDLRADALLVYDLGRGEVTSRVALPAGAHEVLELPDGRIVVSVEQAGQLAIADLDRSTVETIPIGGTPHGLALDGDVLLVTDRATDAVRRFEIEGWRELTPVATGRWPHAVEVGADGRVAVAAALDDAIWLGEELLPVSTLPETLDVSRHGLIATAGATGGMLHLFDQSGAQKWQVFLGGRPVRVQFAPDGLSIAVALSATGEVALVDLEARVRRTPVAGVPDGLAFDLAGERLYVSDVVGGAVTVLNAVDLERLEVLEVGAATGAILTR